MEVMPDHVHLFIAADPTRSVAEIVNRFKGRTSRLLRDEFKSLRSRLPTLWSWSYFAATVGAVSEATIRRSIEAQKGRLNADALLQVQDRAEQDAGGGPFGHACRLLPTLQRRPSAAH